MFEKRVIAIFVLCTYVCSRSTLATKEGKDEDGVNSWKKKDVRDYTDADLERLFEQWEDADEDELEEDELPEWKREPPKVDMSKLDPQDPEGFMKASKKGRTLMMFATVSGNPTEAETDKVSQLWHSSLFNAHIETQRYVVGDNRVLFSLNDGAKAWDVKDFLMTQERCAEVTIEGQTFPGPGASTAKKAGKKGKKEEL